jgi:hypothetical protein
MAKKFRSSRAECKLQVASLPLEGLTSHSMCCQITNGMLLMPLDDATKSVLEQIASLLNALKYN